MSKPKTVTLPEGTLSMAFVPQIKAARAMLGLTLAGMAKASGISKPTLQRLESEGFGEWQQAIARRATMEKLFEYFTAQGFRFEVSLTKLPEGKGDMRYHMKYTVSRTLPAQHTEMEWDKIIESAGPQTDVEIALAEALAREYGLKGAAPESES